MHCTNKLLKLPSCSNERRAAEKDNSEPTKKMAENRPMNVDLIHKRTQRMDPSDSAIFALTFVNRFSLDGLSDHTKMCTHWLSPDQTRRLRRLCVNRYANTGQSISASGFIANWRSEQQKGIESFQKTTFKRKSLNKHKALNVAENRHCSRTAHASCHWQIAQIIWFNRNVPGIEKHVSQWQQCFHYTFSSFSKRRPRL